MLFANLTIRLFGSDDFPLEARQQAAADIPEAARTGHLAIPIGDPLPLERAAEAHDMVEAAVGAGCCCRFLTNRAGRL